MGTFGFSVRPSIDDPTRQSVATAITRISFQVGVGNLPVDGVMTTGWVALISFDTEVLSFNF